MAPRWYFALAMVLTLTSSLLARQGIVRTIDGNSYQGDIDEQAIPDATSVTVTMNGATMTILRSTIVSIEYVDSNQAAFENRLNNLAPTDVKGRLELGQFELERQQFDLARRAALAAQKIDPEDPDTTLLLNTIQAQQVLLAREALAKSAKPAQADAAPILRHPPERLLTADDINLIRQYELRSDDTVRVEFVSGVVKRYLAASGADTVEFNNLKPLGQAMEILKTHDAELGQYVRILDDPHTMLEFHDNLMRRVVVGCAASGCHSSEGFGGLYLYSDVKQAAWYTNFFILQAYGKKVAVSDLFGQGESYRPMIDRVHPESSLIIQYGLPRSLASTPHPLVKDFRPIFSDKADPAYLEAVNWIGTMLKPFQPADYGIDYQIPTGRVDVTPKPKAVAPLPPPALPSPQPGPIITQTPQPAPTTRMPVQLSPIPATLPTTREEPLNKG